ncbi:MAG: TrmH family RNA methyltransferase, partial [Nocardioidaceae bacterium]
MPGSSRRRGAVRKTGKGNPTAGSGGRRRRGLEGKGPTPKAKDRTGHPAQRRAKAADRDGDRRPRRGSSDDGDEWVAGRNAVVEALRSRVPAKTVYVAEGAERDDRLREVFRVTADRGLPITEVTRAELDRMTSRAVHQGIAMRVPAYEYAHPDDLIQAAVDADEPALIVALDSVTDPRNLGAVVRSAAGFGAHGVVVPERRAAGMTTAAWKSSAGAAARIPVARATNLTRQLKA